MSEVSRLESDRDGMKELIARRQMADRLARNPDFKKLILEEFCVQECARYAHSSADPALDAAQRADALNIAQAAGHLKRYLSVVYQMGAHAERTLPDVEDALNDARAEEDAGQNLPSPDEVN